MMVRHPQSPKTAPFQKIWSIALLSLSVWSAAALTTVPMSAIATPTPLLAQSSTTQLPPRVAQRVKRDLAQRLNLSQRTLTVVASSRETWPDRCLGLAAPNERCMTGTVDGWRIELTNGQQNWVYRTDLKAQVIKPETKESASLPPQVVDRLFEAIARQLKVPANTLKVIDFQPRVWDGCMGIIEPGRACTKIAISGYRVIVSGARQSWVYHVSEDGSRIVQNEAASGSLVRVTTSFVPQASQPPQPAETIVFRTLVSGDMTGSVTETFLTTDGTVYQKRTGGVLTPETKVIKRVSPARVQRFQRLLQQQGIQNLNGMGYLTSAVLADYPTTVIQAMGSTVAYIDLEQHSLPKSLKAIIQAWVML